MGHHQRPDAGSRWPVGVTVDEAGWRYLDAGLLRLGPGESEQIATDEREVALVPIAGEMLATAGREEITLRRRSVFSDPPSVLYVPPGTPLELRAVDGVAQCALGAAPAEGRYPLRLFEPGEMRVEMRGGGGALRQVSHILAAPLPAERLVVYEILAPRGTWCGWPPHCHDGYGGSPYLEETYYFRFEPADGFAFHRNYRIDRPFDETFVASDGDLVLVTEGFHTTTTCAGAHMYILNFLAGEPTDGERARPPCFDSRYSWIDGNWDSAAMTLPAGGLDTR
jgi:5-deoxy-glucuronate isomerase